MTQTPLHQMTKRDVLLALLDQGITMVHLDPRAPGVDVPASLAEGPALRLNLSYRFRIPDLDVGEDGVLATLHFPDAGDHRCLIPWDAVYGITSNVSKDGRMWMESMPVEVRVDLARRAVGLLGRLRQTPAPTAEGTDDPPAPPRAPPVDETPPPPPSLRVIAGGQADDPPSDDRPEPPRKRPKLRLVK